ncbi:MAG: peptidoglycan bridge formation glycyltransferase FemA/FemB family protein [Spirochaetales bacterium]|nr:peptidoglycan bridge formation glycyltransferase FemA/FemB family protein [Spirochaetales bacterium]
MTKNSSLPVVTPCALESLTAPIFLQTGLWGKFKSRFGWQAYGFDVDGHSLLVLTRTLRPGLVLAYIPHGPWWSEMLDREGLEERLKNLGLALAEHLPPGVFTLRFDLLAGTQMTLGDSSDEETQTETGFPPPLARPWRKPPDVQPPDTVIVPISSEDEMLARMKKKTRYNIRLAEKKGVRVRQASLSELEAWYELYRETGERDKIALHPLAYYRTLLELAANTPGPKVHLLFAEADLPEGTKLLAGNFVVTHGQQAIYLYGASSNEHRNLMAPYALQWEGLKLAHNEGCTEYDLFGVPPTNDPEHPMHGLFQFKTGFGGRLEHRLGAWDLVLRPAIWNAVTLVDRLRVWYFKVWKKR